MSILTIFQKSSNDVQKEKRCYFGLMSLCMGVIFNSAFFLAMLFAFPMTVSRGERSYPTDVSHIINLAIPIPLTDQEIQILRIFELVHPLMVAYGAHKQSRKLIKSAKNMWCFILAMSYFCFSYCCYKMYTSTLDKRAAIEKELADTDYTDFYKVWTSTFKIFALIFAGFLVIFISAEAYYMYVLGEYEKQLLSK